MYVPMVLPIFLPLILPMNITAILRLIPYPFAVDLPLFFSIGVPMGFTDSFYRQLNVVLTKNCRLFRKFYGKNLRVSTVKTAGFQWFLSKNSVKIQCFERMLDGKICVFVSQTALNVYDIRLFYRRIRT